MKLIRWFGLLLLSLVASLAGAETVIVAVAANFTAAMNAIATEFERETGHDVRLSFGSSGKLYAQIKNGAPFQVFFSADQAKPTALENEGLAVSGSRFTYAVGALALWSAKENLVDDQAMVLNQRRFNKLALANPQLAPYGAAAVEVLKSLNLEKATRDKWVMGENIAQTYQFVGTGNADIGFVALSQIIGNGRISRGSAWIVPAELYNPVRQDAVLLRDGASSDAARKLIEFVRGAKARASIESFGYQTEIGNDQ